MNQNQQENQASSPSQASQKCSNLIQFQQQNNNLKQVFALIEDNFDKYIFDSIVTMFKKVKCLDCIDYLSNPTTKQLAQEYFRELFSFQSTMKNLQNINQLLQQLIEVFQSLEKQDFFHSNFLNNEYQVERKDIIHQIQNNEKSLEFFKFLVRLTAIDSRFIQCGSNSLNLLVELQADLKEQSFEGIRIRDTMLVGANFVCSNLSGSEFDNMDISGMNLNGAMLFNCQWKNLRIHELNKLDGHSSNVNSVCFSPDGSTLASGNGDNSIRLWDVKTGQQKAQLNGHSNAVTSVCFSPDGSTLASGSIDKSIQLWDVKTGQQKAKLKLDGHSSNIWSVCFSSDGSTLASVSGDYSDSFQKNGDNSICLWDIKTGQQKAKLDGHSNCVNSVCFSPDNSTLASGSVDKSIRLWDIQNGKQIRNLDGHSNTVKSVCFSPDGFTGSGDDSFSFCKMVITPSVFGISRLGSRRRNWMVIVIAQFPSASLLTALHWRQAVISPFVFVMSRRGSKRRNQMVIVIG